MLRILLVSVLSCGIAAGELKASVALAMEGGGFRAQSVGAGLFAGLLASTGDSKPSFKESGLLDRVDHLSTVSGSSWFLSSLAYSPSYTALVESMAGSPSTAAAQYKAKWTTPWLKATNVDPKTFDLMGKVARDIVGAILGQGDEDTLYTLKYFLSTNATWHRFTETLLDSTASIGMDVKLGSPVNDWAEGKVWLADHSVLLPTGDKFARLYQTDLDDPEVSYVAKSSTGNVPLMVPAKFSTVLGAGTNSSAPHPYVAGGALPQSIDLDVEAVIVPILDEPSDTSAPLDQRDFCNGVLTEGAGALPVAGAVSASSAFAGVAPVEGLLADEALAIIDADLTPWISNSPNGAAFSTATTLVEGLKKSVSDDAVKALATAQVHGVVDGGYTEGTGVAQAVAAGASEVVVVLNSNATNDPFYVELMFEGGPNPVDPGASRAIFPVFQSPTAAQVKASFTKFNRLQLSSTSEYLKVFTVGTLQVTTAANVYFGIEAGRPVTIHVLNLGSSLSIGTFENFDHYNALAQEVIETLLSQENKDVVQNTILPMFTGAAKRTEVSV